MDLEYRFILLKIICELTLTTKMVVFLYLLDM
jgi:hypothetical protein